MKTVFIIFLCILVFFGCLAIGILSGDFSFPSSQPASAPASPSTPTIASNTIPENNKQQNLVLILIDNLGNPGYHLESVWLLLFTPDYPDITLLMLYPSSKEPYKNLADQFKLTPDGKLDVSFTDALHGFKFNFQGFILVDEEGLSQWIDWMKGIDIDGNTLNGANVLSYTPKPWNDLDKSITPQMTVATGLCKKAILLPKDVNWFTLLGNILPGHMSTDLSLKDTVALWKSFLAQQEKAKCKILTP
jgi:hypothetical protein